MTAMRTLRCKPKYENPRILHGNHKTAILTLSIAFTAKQAENVDPMACPGLWYTRMTSQQEGPVVHVRMKHVKPNKLLKLTTRIPCKHVPAVHNAWSRRNFEHASLESFQRSGGSYGPQVRGSFKDARTTPVYRSSHLNIHQPPQTYRKAYLSQATDGIPLSTASSQILASKAQLIAASMHELYQGPQANTGRS